MNKPCKKLQEQLEEIESRVAKIEELFLPKNIVKKKKKPLITDAEARVYLLRTVFKVKL